MVVSKRLQPVCWAASNRQYPLLEMAPTRRAEAAMGGRDPVPALYDLLVGKTLKTVAVAKESWVSGRDIGRFHTDLVGNDPARGRQGRPTH